MRARDLDLEVMLNLHPVHPSALLVERRSRRLTISKGPQVLNIVNPDSTITQESAPFTLLGNRGVLHEGGRLVHGPRSGGWIYCRTFALTDPRELMKPGEYTELFFLDEATALAAGHRPCGRCHHARSHAFCEAWKRVFKVDEVTSDDVDRVLKEHREARSSQRTLQQINIDELPAGVMIREPGHQEPLLVFDYEHPKGSEHRCVYPWTSHGYGLKRDAPVGPIEVLTPGPIVEVIRQGFAPGPEHPLLAW